MGVARVVATFLRGLVWKAPMGAVGAAVAIVTGGIVLLQGGSFKPAEDAPILWWWLWWAVACAGFYLVVRGLGAVAGWVARTTGPYVVPARIEAPSGWVLLRKRFDARFPGKTRVSRARMQAADLAKEVEEILADAALTPSVSLAMSRLRPNASQAARMKASNDDFNATVAQGQATLNKYGLIRGRALARFDELEALQLILPQQRIVFERPVNTSDLNLIAGVLGAIGAGATKPKRVYDGPRTYYEDGNVGINVDESSGRKEG